MANWKIQIDNISLGGLAPNYANETYPSYGNKNSLGAMTNIDLTNSGYLQQGPWLNNLTNGTEAGGTGLTTNLRGIYAKGTESGFAGVLAVGGNKFYLIDSNGAGSTVQVKVGGNYPHTISNGMLTGLLAEDVILFQGNAYYTYNCTSDTTKGDIGKYDSSTFTDNWGSTGPSGAASLTAQSTNGQNTPHQLAVAGSNNLMFFANAKYIGTYDNSTLRPQQLVLPSDMVAQSIVWMQDRLWIACNSVNSGVAGEMLRSSIFVWDGAAATAESEIKVEGQIGALYSKNNVMYVWYQDNTSLGGYKLGYVNGLAITDLCNYSGGLPAYYQVTHYKGFLAWIAGSSIYLYGSGDTALPARLFQYASAGYATAGGMKIIPGNGVSQPYGVMIVSSTNSTNYRVAQLAQFDLNSSVKTLMFDVTGTTTVPAKIDGLRINFEKLATGALVTWKLLNNQGSTIYTDTISFAKLGAKTSAYYPLNGLVAENFRVEFDYSLGAQNNNSVPIKNIKIWGTN